MAENGANYMQPSVAKFDGHYSHWAMLMENLLRSKEYWNLVEKGVFVPPANPTAEQMKMAEESKIKDLKVKNYLFQAIDRSILETILPKDSSKEIWDSMNKKYKGSSKIKRAQLNVSRKEFEMLNMKEGETIDEYFSRTLTIVNRMKMYGETVEQETVVEKVLRSLTEKFNYVVCSIEHANDVTKLSIDELQSSLLVEEQRMKGRKENKFRKRNKYSKSQILMLAEEETEEGVAPVLVEEEVVVDKTGAKKMWNAINVESWDITDRNAQTLKKV